MILGLFLILLAAFLNVVLLLIPLSILELFTAWVIDLIQKVHWIGRAGAALGYLILFAFGILLAACIQLIVWGLAPGAEPGRWTLAVAAFGIGQVVLLVIRYKDANSQAMRRVHSWLSAVRVCGFSALCLFAYASVTVHGLLARIPGSILHFILGGHA